MELYKLAEFIGESLRKYHTECYVTETPNGIILVTGNDDSVSTFKLKEKE